MTHTAELFKLLVLVLLRISHSKMVQLHTEENSRSPEVIKWLEVYNRSFCQPRDVIVDINTEYPEEVEYIFMPSCVVLKRCAGCCVDEELECVPVRTQTVIMQIMKRKYLQSQMVEMQFLQHNRCECRPKRETKVKPERKRKKEEVKGHGQSRKRKKQKQFALISQCSPCTEKRRHLNLETCECTCKMTQLRCRAKGLELNERNCRCETVRR